MISYVVGDIFDSKCQAITIPVNIVGVAGAGLAKSWAQHDPGALAIYHQLCKENHMHVGEVVVMRHLKMTWVLFPTKQHYSNPSQVGWIEQGLEHLYHSIRVWNLRSIAIPALGCGLGGLDWNIINSLIVSKLNQSIATIHVYPPLIR